MAVAAGAGAGAAAVVTSEGGLEPNTMWTSLLIIIIERSSYTLGA